MNDASAFVVVKAIDPFLVDHPVDWFDSIERQSVTMTPQLREEYVAVRADFAHLSARTRILMGDERLKSSNMPELHAAAAESLSLSKIISKELIRVEDAMSREDPESQQDPTSGENPLIQDGPTFEMVPLDFLDDLLDDNWKQLDRLDGELRLQQNLDGYASSLKDAVDELMSSKRMSPEPFQNIADRIIDDINAASGEQPALIPNGLLLGSSIGFNRAGDESPFYAVGIAAARLMAWTAPSCDLSREDVACLVQAALLQDIGLLRLGRAHRTPVVQLAIDNPDRYHRHPMIGAALVGGIDDISVDLPILVGRHHERLDGSGYPRQLRARHLLPASRLMAIVSRFVELSSSPIDSSSPHVSSRSVEETGRTDEFPANGQGLAVASKLYREAEKGMFDVSLTRVLLERLGYTFKTRSRPERPVRPERVLRRDDSHIGTKHMHTPEVAQIEVRGSSLEAKVYLPHALTNRENTVRHSRAQRTLLRSRHFA